jgi:hypothetical protein
MERIYFNKLNIDYFKYCINESITYYSPENFDKDESLKRLETLCTHIVGLRDTFYIFSIDDIEDQLHPVKLEIERLKGMVD